MATAGQDRQQRKIIKRVRFDINPLFDRDNDSPDEDRIKNRYVNESEVFEEDPLDPAKEFSDSLILTEEDFWDHVYNNLWKGRLRVREGNLQRTLIRIFDEMVVNRKIGSTESTRYYQAIQLRGRKRNNAILAGMATSENKVRRKKKREARMEDYVLNSDDTKYGAIKVILTYYGGQPLGRRQKVAFNTFSNVDTSPRLTRLQSIVKGTRLKTRRQAILETEKDLDLIIQKLRRKNLQFFSTRTPLDFKARCLQGANDFVVIKEQILNSKDWKISTSITISRKTTSRFRLFKLSDAMPKFYGNKTMVVILTE